MPQPPAPLTPPQETPGKLEGISKKLIPFAILLFLLSLGYYFSIFFINREIKVKEIKQGERLTGVTSDTAGTSPALSGFSGESPPIPDSTPVTTTPSPHAQNNDASTEGTLSPTLRTWDSTKKSASPQNIPTAGTTSAVIATPTPSTSTSTSPSPIPFHKKINLNTAKADDFTALPGLGIKKSLAIIEYRRNNGPFKTTEDIMKVKGIGKKLYEKIKAWIYVE